MCIAGPHRPALIPILFVFLLSFSLHRLANLKMDLAELEAKLDNILQDLLISFGAHGII
jgi:hypothetical protein